MATSRTKMNQKTTQLTRDAAVALVCFVGFILGFCFLWLRFTVWKPSEPVAKEPFYSTVRGVNMEHLTPARAETQ